MLVLWENSPNFPHRPPTLHISLHSSFSNRCDWADAGFGLLREVVASWHYSKNWSWASLTDGLSCLARALCLAGFKTYGSGLECERARVRHLLKGNGGPRGDWSCAWLALRAPCRAAAGLHASTPTCRRRLRRRRETKLAQNYSCWGSCGTKVGTERTPAWASANEPVTVSSTRLEPLLVPQHRGALTNGASDLQPHHKNGEKK